MLCHKCWRKLLPYCAPTLFVSTKKNKFALYILFFCTFVPIEAVRMTFKKETSHGEGNSIRCTSAAAICDAIRDGSGLD